MIENQASSVCKEIKEHHGRWSNAANYKKLADRKAAVTVAFVRSKTIDTIKDSTKNKQGLRAIPLNGVPLLLVAYDHCAFSWRCVLLLPKDTTTSTRNNVAETERCEFTLDIDGVAMKLVDAEQRKLPASPFIEIAQRPVASAGELVDASEAIRSKNPRNIYVDVLSSSRRKTHRAPLRITPFSDQLVSVPYPWTVSALRQALHKENLLQLDSACTIQAPNRFNRMELITNNQQVLPLWGKVEIHLE